MFVLISAILDKVELVVPIVYYLGAIIWALVYSALHHKKNDAPGLVSFVITIVVEGAVAGYCLRSHYWLAFAGVFAAGTVLSHANLVKYRKSDGQCENETFMDDAIMNALSLVGAMMPMLTHHTNLLTGYGVTAIAVAAVYSMIMYKKKGGCLL